MDPTFESFAQLVSRLGNPPKTKKFDTTGRAIPYTADAIFRSWIQFASPFSPGTGKRLFRLLYPDDGSRRRYGLKETKLAAELEQILGVNGLREWDRVGGEGRGGQGCLGDVLRTIMASRLPEGTSSKMTFTELDSLLDQLAASSTFSQLSLPPAAPLTPTAILRMLFRDSGFSPFALGVLVQVILRDLRPLLCPLPVLSVRHPSLLLGIKITEAPEQLALQAAMRIWDKRMASLYRSGKGNVDWCADAAESFSASHGGDVLPDAPGPVVGMNVQAPKCVKGTSVRQALSGFFESSRPKCSSAWAETKYDGYRMQVHVKLENGTPELTIFSKSKRRSTVERGNSHAAVYAALGLPVPAGCPLHPLLSRRLAQGTPPRRLMTSSVILEAEVVPYNEGDREGGRGPGIEEFWWLDRAGVTADSSSRTSSADPRHLCLAIFDILLLDGANLLATEYAERRRILESVVCPVPGFAILAERVEIPLHLGLAHASSILDEVFSESNNQREEGLVLKASTSLYCDLKLRWVKLKKDYIPGLGDCVDLVLLGAGWNINRARELRVDTSVYTTFYFGTLTNREAVRAHREAPHFELLFCASYGASRDQLQNYNENIRLRRWPSKPFDKDDRWKRRLIGLSWKYTIPHNMTPPSVLLEQPLCAEVMGAGFMKLPMSNLYELRWPRLQKIYDKRERPWTSALSAPELLATAHKALGYTPQPAVPQSPEDDSFRAMLRSWSTAAVDIPDLSPSQKRAARTPTRRATVPGTLKLSPSTPKSSTSSRLSQGPPSSPIPGRLIFAPSGKSGKRLADAISTPLTPITSPAIRAREALETNKRRRVTLPVQMPSDQLSPSRLSSPSRPPKPLSLRSRLSLARTPHT